MRKKVFHPEKYGRITCPVCCGKGILDGGSKRQVCPKCGGFGWIRKEK